jgi:hypothetical protein
MTLRYSVGRRHSFAVSRQILSNSCSVNTSQIFDLAGPSGVSFRKKFEVRTAGIGGVVE